MLIWLTELDDEEIKKDEAIIFIQRLAIAAHQGKICLFGEVDIIKRLATNSDLSKLNRSVFGGILSRYSDLGGKYSKFKRCIRVSISELDIICEDGIFINCGYRSILGLAFDDFMLLAENHNDAYLYELIARELNPYRKYGVELNLSPLGGGGSTICNFVESFCDQNRPFICIVDSDREHPSAGLGSTASNIKSAFKNKKISDLLVLNVHEAENLIPLSIIESIASNNSSAKVDAFDGLSSLVDLNQSILKYFDLKNGMDVTRAIKLDVKHDCNYWGLALVNYKKLNKCCRISLNNQRASCECLIVEGFGDKILEQALGFLKKTNVRRLFESMSKCQQEVWNEIAEFIANWACCPSQARRS